MYSYIKGYVTEINSNNITVEANGVGFLIYVPNPFCYEIDKEYIDKERPKKLEKIITKVRKTVDKNATYEVGEHISHTEFGEGIVISVDKSIITVAFPHPFGIRKLMKGHPNITKL